MNNSSSSLDFLNSSMDNNMIKITEKNFLQKKTERNNNKKVYNKIIKKKEKKQEETNSMLNSERLKNQHQMKINDFFENKNMNILSSNDNDNYFNTIKSQEINNGKYTIYYNRNNSKSAKRFKTPKINNPFVTFSKMLKEKQLKSKYNILIEKGIFTEKEISKIFDIIKEYNTEINDSLIPDTDKLIKITNYFLNKGFNEKVRYTIYKCLINYGIPNVEKYNNFFNNVNFELSKKKLNTPEKMYVLLYVEYIGHFIKNELNMNSIAKNKFISEFYFNRENIEIVTSNLNFINTIKSHSTNIEKYLQSYLANNFDNFFEKAKLKINDGYPKAKDVIIKMLSNIIIKCEKNGFLAYNKIIDDNNIIFEGLKIKGKNLKDKNLEQMISIKLFNIELSEKKLRNAVKEYFLILVSNFKD